MQKSPIFRLFLICNPNCNIKYALNLNAKGVNLNVMIKAEYSIIFLYIVRNFAIMSDFGNLGQFFMFYFLCFMFYFCSFCHFEL